AARPIQAAFASALSFAVGAALPVITVLLAPRNRLTIWISATALVLLAVLGAVAAKTGGANPFKGAARVTFWSALAMLLTAGVGSLFGTAVG
ncbi:MAG TPA: VIT1/CCC1 transporter family protein, partial [Steroidobacteraceae bacterium]|nr:VIT1/CCC1 transporter family protein [Steroidobacteraceae bacterium]